MSLRARTLSLGLVVLTAILATSCVQLLDPARSFSVAGRPSGPASTADLGTDAGQLFYPLAIGNHWSYDNTYSVSVVADDGTTAPAEEFQSTTDVDLTRHQELNGRDYLVQRETYRSPDFETSAEFLYRQDFSGLFNADWIPTDETADDDRLAEGVGVSSSVDEPTFALDPGLGAAKRRAVMAALAKLARVRQVAAHGFTARARGRATPGPLEGEVALLLYPLHAGSTWHAREDPLVVYTVEGEESIQLPAGQFNGWRIRIDWPGVFGPNDSVLVWYGRDGLLRLSAHLESSDPGYEFVSDSDQVLTGFSLVGRAAS